MVQNGGVNSPSYAAIAAAETRWHAALQRATASSSPADTRAEQEAWETLSDLKGDAGLCIQPGCRTKADRAHCPQHSED
jgi:hypothetical protein